MLFGCFGGASARVTEGGLPVYEVDGAGQDIGFHPHLLLGLGLRGFLAGKRGGFAQNWGLGERAGHVSFW